MLTQPIRSTRWSCLSSDAYAIYRQFRWIITGDGGKVASLTGNEKEREKNIKEEMARKLDGI